MEVENVPVVEQPVIEPVANPQAPAVTPEVTPEVAPVSEYELPDGTKADAETLAKAWKENFMPDYTRKAQELAALKQQLSTKEEKPTDTPNHLDNPDWQPESYQQLAVELKKQVWNEILESASAEERQAAERDAYIEREKQEVLSLDKNADLNRVMAHAAKYAYPSLIPAYQNMKAMDEAVRIAEERILKNIQARSASPVGSPTSGGAPESFPSDVRTGLEKARYILRNKS